AVYVRRGLACLGPCLTAAATPPPGGNLRRMQNARVFVQKNAAPRGKGPAPRHRSRSESTRRDRFGASAPIAQRTPPAWTQTAVQELSLPDRGRPQLQR